MQRITWRFIWAKAEVSSSNTLEVTLKSMKNPKMKVSLKWFSDLISLKLKHGVFSLFRLQILNKWTQNYDLGLKLKHHKRVLVFPSNFLLPWHFHVWNARLIENQKNTFSVDVEKPSQFWSHLLNCFDFSFLTNQSKRNKRQAIPYQGQLSDFEYQE